MYGDFVLGSTGDTLLEALSRVSMHIAHCTVHEGNEGRKTHQLVKNTAVQGHLGLSAFPQVLVVILETFPVGRKLLQAVGVDILDPVHTNIILALPFFTLFFFPEKKIPKPEPYRNLYNKGK